MMCVVFFDYKKKKKKKRSILQCSTHSAHGQIAKPMVTMATGSSKDTIKIQDTKIVAMNNITIVARIAL